MKLIRYLIPLVALVVSTQISAAATQGGKQVETTRDLIALCSVSADDPTYAAAMGFCLGYIDATMHYHRAVTAGPSRDPIACPQHTVTRQELVAVLMDWSEGNAQHLDSETPVHGLMRAASAKWPCSAQ